MLRHLDTRRKLQHKCNPWRTERYVAVATTLALHECRRGSLTRASSSSRIKSAQPPPPAAAAAATSTNPIAPIAATAATAAPAAAAAAAAAAVASNI